MFRSTVHHQAISTKLTTTYSVNCPSSSHLYKTHNNIFRSTVHHQAISTKLKTGCNTVQIIFLLYGTQKTDLKPRIVKLHYISHSTSFVSPKEALCPWCQKWLQCRPALLLIDFSGRLFITAELFLYSVSSCISLGTEVNN